VPRGPKIFTCDQTASCTDTSRLTGC